MLMNYPSEQITELQRLYRANYERMMAYDQAGNAAREQHLKDFFLGKAEESEQAAQAIQDFLPDELSATSSREYILPGTRLFEKVIHQKPATFLIACAKQVESAMAGLYHQIVTELSSFPDAIMELIKLQQEQIRRSKLQMNQL